jgi:hypothetical protein
MTLSIDDEDKLNRAALQAQKSFDCWDQFVAVPIVDIAVKSASSKPDKLSGKIDFAKTRAEKDS